MTKADFSLECVVAATDFSANGDMAVMRAAHIAKRDGKALHLLHVVHPLDIYPELMLSFDSHIKDYERLKQANGLESLDKLAIQIRSDFGIDVITASRIGRAHIQIAEYAKDESSGLVVVGYRGDNNILDAVMGSTAFRLLRIAECPVLIVKNAEVVPYKEAVAAVDLSPLSLQVVQSACMVAHHADEVLADLLEKVDDKRVSSMVANGYLPENICSRVIAVNADLIVLGKKDKSSLQEFVLGSVSKTVAGMVACDVMLI